MDAVRELYYEPQVVTDLSGGWDAVVVVANEAKDLPSSLSFITSAIKKQIEVSS